MRPFELYRPRSAAEAVRILAADPAATVLAGGTDVVTLLRDEVFTPARVVDIRRTGMDLVDWGRPGVVRIGATYTNAAAVAEPRLSREFPVLVRAISAGASPQIRNMATFGGNIMQRPRCNYYRLPEFPCNRRNPGSGCGALTGDGVGQAVFGASPACNAVHPSDLAVALQVLDANVLVTGVNGDRSIPVDEFHLLPGDTPQSEHALRPGELVTGIELPRTDRARTSHYLKFRERASFAFAMVSAAVAVELAGSRVVSARIALGGVAPKPWRCRAAEAALTGKAFDEAAINAAAEASVQGAAPRPDTRHKVEFAKRVVRQALRRLQRGGNR